MEHFQVTEFHWIQICLVTLRIYLAINMIWSDVYNLFWFFVIVIGYIAVNAKDIILELWGYHRFFLLVDLPQVTKVPQWAVSVRVDPFKKVTVGVLVRWRKNNLQPTFARQGSF